MAANVSKFSQKSLDKLYTCDHRLVAICLELIKEIDFTVICGTRSKEDQDKAVAGGFSRTIYPTSKHNKNPSEAVDLAPYPIDWNDIDRFKDLAVRFKRIAEEKGIAISAGADWKMRDYPHFELA